MRVKRSFLIVQPRIIDGRHLLEQLFLTKCARSENGPHAVNPSQPRSIFVCENGWFGN